MLKRVERKRTKVGGNCIGNEEKDSSSRVLDDEE